MTRFVLDCSVAASWCFEDKANPYGEVILDRLCRDEALVPAIWQLEIGNVLLSAECEGRITKAQSARLVELLQGLPITVDREAAERGVDGVLALARDYGLSVCDACYLELAMREGLPIATQKELLLEAARRSGVEPA